jgi:hypothetical protein
MTAFSFTSIDVPAAEGTYTYIGVVGVDAAGEAAGYYGYVDGDDDRYFHGLIATGPAGTPFEPPNSTNTDVAGITAGGEIFGTYVDNFNREHSFVDNNGVVTQFDIFQARSSPASRPQQPIKAPLS